MCIFLKIQELSNLIFFKCIFSAIISLSYYYYYYANLFKNFKYINIYFILDPNSMNGMKYTLLTYQRLKWQRSSILLCFFKDLLITLSLTLFLVSTTLSFVSCKIENWSGNWAVLFSVLHFTMVLFLHSPTIDCIIAAVWFSSYEPFFQFNMVQFSFLS